eukprot:4196505-Alexandrium_andersonii.AAC.1
MCASGTLETVRICCKQLAALLRVCCYTLGAAGAGPEIQTGPQVRTEEVPRHRKSIEHIRPASSTPTDTQLVYQHPRAFHPRSATVNSNTHNWRVTTTGCAFPCAVAPFSQHIVELNVR